MRARDLADAALMGLALWLGWALVALVAGP